MLGNSPTSKEVWGKEKIINTTAPVMAKWIQLVSFQCVDGWVTPRYAVPVE